MNTKAILLFVVAAGVLAPVPTSNAQDMSGVEITATDLGGGVYMLFTGRGGNMGFCVGDDGVFLIDDQYAPLTDKIVAAVRTVSDKPIRFLVNTHMHPDHTGGNENFGKMGTLIFGHENVRTQMGGRRV